VRVVSCCSSSLPGLAETVRAALVSTLPLRRCALSMLYLVRAVLLRHTPRERGKRPRRFHAHLARASSSQGSRTACLPRE